MQDAAVQEQDGASFMTPKLAAACRMSDVESTWEFAKVSGTQHTPKWEKSCMTHYIYV